MKTVFYFMFTFLLIASCSESSNGPVNDCTNMPQGNDTILVRIIQVLPNPEGKIEDNEDIVIRNFGNEKVNLNNWTIVNTDSLHLDLFVYGTLSPCEMKTYVLQGTDRLKNDGDTLWFYDNQGTLVQTVYWKDTQEGQIIYP